ncbi:transmembrane protein 116-like [Saccoglossus kowalevskii]|uniref:Transmembrane protein 116-like n=1 Tax=Saccoglossus kowalevskii TaxID=10224 RepID=A0ABM0GTK9_SACKO|nr:PREDICTED: transmembrane protein 116-like [Saccoglossus kowalevskii]
MEASVLNNNSCSESDPQTILDMKILSYVHIIVASLSIIGASSIIVYSIYRNSCTTLDVRPLFHLSIADLCLSICWVLGATFWIVSFQNGRVNFDIMEECPYLQAVTQAFHIATFFLTVNYALNVYIRIKDKQNRANDLRPLMESWKMVWVLRSVYIFAWLAPIALMVPVVYLNIKSDEPDDNDCGKRCLLFISKPSCNVEAKNHWLCANYATLVFVLALGLSIIALLIIYGLSFRVYRQLVFQNVWTDRQRAAVSSMRYRITLYILVFLFCWLPAFTVAITQLVMEEIMWLHTYFTLYLVQGITAPSQGFLNCLVYGWTRPAFIRANPQSRYSTPGSATTTPLTRTTYRSYGVGESRKTWKRSTLDGSGSLSYSTSSTQSQLGLT